MVAGMALGAATPPVCTWVDVDAWFVSSLILSFLLKQEIQKGNEAYGIWVILSLMELSIQLFRAKRRQDHSVKDKLTVICELATHSTDTILYRRYGLQWDLKLIII